MKIKTKKNSTSKKVSSELEDVINEVSGGNEEAIENSNITEEVIKEDKITEEEIVETVVTKNRNEYLSIEDKISEWKVQYDEIFETIIAGQKFIWKPLNRHEYKEGYQYTEDRDMFIVKAACLYPSPDVIEDLLYRKAGVGFVMVEVILAESGFNVESSKKL